MSRRRGRPAPTRAVAERQRAFVERPRSTSGRRRTPEPPAGSGIRHLVLPSIFLVAALAGIAVLAITVTSPAPPVAAGPRPSLGTASAPVAIHEFADFQCPSCGAFTRRISPELRTRYVDTGIARIVWHDFAWIGRESRDAANAARCAGDQGAFWAYHDLLYANQAGENVGAFSRERLKAFGLELQLDAALFDPCVDGDVHLAAVEADLSDVRRRGLTGTPSFLIGDQRIVGAQSVETFAAAIEAARAGG